MPSEIEKLERRYAENPKGRNFAPLADAYRKAGQLDQAIELCKSGIERHPDYVSAHIVFGRCLIDMKYDPGAKPYSGTSMWCRSVIVQGAWRHVSDRGDIDHFLQRRRAGALMTRAARQSIEQDQDGQQPGARLEARGDRPSASEHTRR